MWLKYCCVYPSGSQDSANPPGKSLSGHPFVWLSKTDKKFSFCTPEELCPLEIWDGLAGYALKTTVGVL